jgi:hypothetical protein
MERKREEHVTTTVRPAKQDRTTLVLLMVAALVAVGGIGFALGHLTAPAASAAANATRGPGGFVGGRGFPSLAPGQTFDTSQFGAGAGARGGLGGVAGGVTGTVQSVSGSAITIQEANGSSVTIDISGTTTYHNETSAQSSDVKVGSGVVVQIDTSSLASEAPDPSASGGLGGRTLTAKDVLITTP